MPSRINNTYWGNSNTWVWSNGTYKQCKMSPRFYPDIINDHNELLNDFYDTSVAVWGVPYDCSVGRRTTVSWYADNNGDVITEYKEPYMRTNVPLTILVNSSTTPLNNRINTDPYVFNYYNCRVRDNVELATRSYSETYDNSGTYSTTHQLKTTGGGTSPYYNLMALQSLSYDYRQNLYSVVLTLMPKTSFTSGNYILADYLDNALDTTWSTIKSRYSYENDEDIIVIGVSYEIYTGLRLNSSATTRSNARGNPVLYPQVSMEPSSRTESIYYNNNNGGVGDGVYSNLNCIGLGYSNDTVLKYPNYHPLPTANTYFGGRTTAYYNTRDIMTQCDQMFAASRKKQKFSDVEYHWTFGLKYADDSSNSHFTVHELENLNLSELTDGMIDQISLVCYLVIDDDKGNGYKQACRNAIMHEQAFYGMPFTTTKTDAVNAVWDNDETDIYIPLFDENMITTGEYVTLKAAYEQYLPQSVWIDIFNEQSIYNYDPDFQPEPPSPEENDYGDTSNLGSARGLFPAGVNIYLMSRLDYNTFMAELNSYYANSTPDDWTLDFQGVNPSDYILNVYYTPYNFVKSDTKSNVKIGQITLTTEAYELSQGSPGVDDPNKWKYFTYGTRKVTPLHNDFRDYDPYTKVELYLPLAGTIDLDTNYVMNHNITVEYYFDLMTMSGVAAVYRDSMLYKTSDFKLGAQVPLLITNMGQIQNQITQLEFSQKQNNLRLATSAISSGVSIGSILAGGGEVSTGQAIGAAGGSFALVSGIMKADEIDYQLKHTSPSVSVTGAAEPLNNYSVGQLTPKLIIKRPLMLNTLDNAIYSKTIGNSCCINTTLDTMTGLVVCSSVDTTGIQKEISTGVYISPTIDEVNMIKSTFNSGVIL